MAVNCLGHSRCDSVRSSDSEGTDDQMHQRPGPAVEISAAMENTARAASAHPDGVAARERDDTAFDCRGKAPGNDDVARAANANAGAFSKRKSLMTSPFGRR